MRIVIAAMEGSPPIEGNGGVENLLVGWAHGLSALGHEVTLAASGQGSQEAGTRRPNEPFLRIGLSRPGQLNQYAEAWKADIVSVHNNPGWAAFIQNTPVAATFHNTQQRIWDGIAGRDAALVPEGLQKATALSAVSQWAASEVEKLSGRENVMITYPFAHQAFFEVQTYPWPSTPNVLFFGRMMYKKGLGTLCDAIRILDGSIDVTITDFSQPWLDQDEFASIRKTVNSLPRTRLVPVERERSTTARMVAAHRVCVSPSQWGEPFGMVSVEAQAAGRRAVVTADGGLPETAGPNAIIVPPADPQKLAEALYETVNAGPPSLHGVDWVAERFSLEKSSEQFAKFLEVAANVTR